MMRVLHLVKTSVGATWALRQMRELVRNNVEVHVALPAGGPIENEYLNAGIAVHHEQTDSPMRKPWLWPKRLATMRDLVRRVSPDIIHSHFVGTTLVMRLALGKYDGTPRIFQIPGPLHLEHSLYRRGELVTAGPLDYWIGSCQWTCECYLKSGLPKDHIFKSYYGIDLDNFSSYSKTRNQLRNELGMNSDVPLVGMVAYMYAPKKYLGQRRGIKGHEDLIDALAICRKNIPNLKAVFIGGAWGTAAEYEYKVRKYASKRLGDAAVFLGTRSDVAELYPDLNVAVHPSHSENVGGAGESLLMGVPTIATRVGGFPDVIIPGKTGWLVPPKNPERLSEAILKAINNQDHAKKLARNGRELVRKRFDGKKTSQEILEIYKKVSRN